MNDTCNSVELMYSVAILWNRFQRNTLAIICNCRQMENRSFHINTEMITKKKINHQKKEKKKKLYYSL